MRAPEKRRRREGASKVHEGASTRKEAPLKRMRAPLKWRRAPVVSRRASLKSRRAEKGVFDAEGVPLKRMTASEVEQGVSEVDEGALTQRRTSFM